VDGTVPGSCPMSDFDITGFELIIVVFITDRFSAATCIFTVL
jgi:hypothetical protein